ncbi:hypothetical protein TIFTF001_031015 [Ficus carica]|uniref:Bulb-type lectin domain-containing protein n=1 Tax=Ficus carica TaxID=3494 RepID=A0AA88DUR9_FICCA|nr:hypothetical protein TIFTF001_031015 [Ficus carica]
MKCLSLVSSIKEVPKTVMSEFGTRTSRFKRSSGSPTGATRLTDSSGLLTINSTGNLVLLYRNKSVVWSTKLSKQDKKPLVQILDSGNLVLKDEEDRNAEDYLWQSFDDLSNTLLPGMKLGWDLRKGLNRRVSAWRNWDDPCPGDFIWGVEFNAKYQASPEAYMWKGVMNQTTSTRERFTWVEAEKRWKLYSSEPRDLCDKYGLCGGNGDCVIGENPVCQCFKGFKPKSEEK